MKKSWSKILLSFLSVLSVSAYLFLYQFSTDQNSSETTSVEAESKLQPDVAVAKYLIEGTKAAREIIRKAQ